MRYIIIVFPSIILLLLAGCASRQSTSATKLHVTPSPFTQSTKSEQDFVASAAYPEPSSISAYPGADASSTSSVNERSLLDTGFDPNAPIPSPAPNLTTVTGYVFFKNSNTPLVNVPVILSQIYRNEQDDGVFVYDTATSPYALTDINGRFIFSDVEPTEFIILVGNVEVNNYEIVKEPNGEAKFLNLLPGKILDLGVIKVDLDW